jgi:hypothetical protein
MNHELNEKINELKVGKAYASVLPFDHEDETGVYFGLLENDQVTDPEDRDRMPAMLVMPHIIWDHNEKPKDVTVFFAFGELEAPMLIDYKGLFLEQIIDEES